MARSGATDTIVLVSSRRKWGLVLAGSIAFTASAVRPAMSGSGIEAPLLGDAGHRRGTVTGHIELYVGGLLLDQSFYNIWLVWDYPFNVTYSAETTYEASDVVGSPGSAAIFDGLAYLDANAGGHVIDWTLGQALSSSRYAYWKPYTYYFQTWTP